MTGQQSLRAAFIALALAAPLVACPISANGSEADNGKLRPARVRVEFATSRGARVQAERMNNVSRAATFSASRDADVAFYNEQGLHGQIYRVWVDTSVLYKDGNYDPSALNDYLGDLSRLSDNLLVVLDTRVEIRDRQAKPADIQPIVYQVMRDLKQRFPQIRYIEAFNEPDYNLAKVLKPEDLYDYYKVYYEAVDRVNRELRPKVKLEVGAAGFMSYDEPWLLPFLDRYQADTSKAKRLDFVSWHGYGEFPPGNGGKAGPRAYHFYKFDPSEVVVQRGKFEAALRRRGLPTTIPSFITELGTYPGPSFDNQADARPDYLIGAAGTSSLLYWYMEQPRTVPFNWVLRHFAEERKDQLVTRAANGQPAPIKGSDSIAIPTRTFTPYGNAMAMMSKLKAYRVGARSDTLVAGRGVYAIATRDRSGAAIMLWNYQHTGATSYRVDLDLGRLPAELRGEALRQRLYRIDDKVSNYWANPATANLQEISAATVKPGATMRLTVDLTPNAFELVILEPAGTSRRR